MNFKKILMTLLIMLAICGMTMNCASATSVAHRGKCFNEGDYLCTCKGKPKTGNPYIYNGHSWDSLSDYKNRDLDDEQWTDMLRDLADEGYCKCICYVDKTQVIYVFGSKVMPEKYKEWYWKYTCLDFRVRISVNNGNTKFF